MSRNLYAGRTYGGITMYKDPIVEDIRKHRQEYARQFNFDIRAIAADLKKKEERHQDKLVSFPSKPARYRKTV